MSNQVKMINEIFSYFDPKDADKKTGVRYPVDWGKVAGATKATLDIPESNLDKNDPSSIMYNPPEKSIVVERKYCLDCKSWVQAEIGKYDPDDPNSLLIWQCKQCGNAIEFFE